MTPEERAKNIASLLNYSPALADTNYAAVIKEIKQACAEAMANEFAEGALNQQNRCKEHTKQAYEKGFSDCRERTAILIDQRLERCEIRVDKLWKTNAELAAMLQDALDKPRNLQKEKPQ